MNAPAAATQRSSLKERLEAALNSGASPEALMSEIASACSASANAAWEALALIDQYYRRRRITQDVYRSLKTETERLALGRAMHAEPGPKAPPDDAQILPGSPLAAAAPAAPAPAAPATPSEHIATTPVTPPPRPQPWGRPMLAERSAERSAGRGAARTAELPRPPAGERIVGERGLDQAALSGAGKSADDTGEFARPEAPRAGQLLRGRYRLEARLDYGGGVVFQALDEFRKELPEDEQRIAIRFPDNAVEAQRAFYRAQQLSHPNIARLIEFDRDGELVFYTMELLHGRLLRDVLKHATHLPLPQPEALGILRDVAAALQHAHARQLVHGQLDTASVLITQSGGVRVLNFGVPRADGAWVEPRDDLSALCLLAYELLAGFPAYDGRSLYEARKRKVRLRKPANIQANQWRALQRGLSNKEKARGLTIEQWLREMDVGAAPERPITPEVLIQAQPPRHWPRPLLLTGSLLLIAGAIAVPAYKYWQSASLRGAPGVPASVAPTAAVTAAPDGGAPTAPTATAPSSIASAPTSGREPTPGTAARLVTGAPVATDGASAGAPASPTSSPAPATIAPESGSAASVTEGSSTAGAPPADTGPGLLGFQAESFTVAPGESAARIPVRRVGGTRGDVGVVWATEDGSAHAGEDFTSFGRQHETIPSGQKSVTLFIPLSADLPRDQQSDFYVTLSEPGGGAKLGKITRLKVIVAASGN